MPTVRRASTDPAVCRGPRIKEFEIWRGRVAGTRHHPVRRTLELLAMAGANAWLFLVREPNNPHDPRAIAVYWGPIKLGYVPAAANALPASLIDQGAGLGARLIGVDHADPRPIEVAVVINGVA